jgi:L-threonylcarbamoyladenylate synthase
MKTFSSDITACVAELQANGIILYPTDTIWGIGCDATKSGAIQKIFQLKKKT